MKQLPSGLRRWLPSALFVAALLTLALVFRGSLQSWFSSQAPGAHEHAAAPSSSASSDIAHYTCSMHPSVKQAGPGKCPICGMALIPVTREQQQQGLVIIDDARRQLIGVKTGQVVEAPMQRELRAAGRVAYDESALSEVNLKVSGWITKLLVNKTGQRVSRGQTLFTLYSPELYGAEQELLLAIRGAAASDGSASARSSSLAKAARERLRLLGESDAQLDALEKRGTPSQSIAIASPASGFVIEKEVVEGASVQAGAKLYRIAALSQVWVEAEIYEADLPHVTVGQSASVTLDYLPEQAYGAKVAYVYPYIDPAARTGRVRVELQNKALELRPGMYASIELKSASATRLQVPAAAVVYTGPRRLVFLDLGEGRFRPQEVKLGLEAGGMYEVLSGLKAGDSVATSGVFLIAAEARITTAATYWDKAPDDQHEHEHEHAPPPSPPAAPSAAPAPKPAAPAARPSSKAPAETIYTCPMHPEVRSNAPGTCPKCGMKLEPVAPGGSP